MSFETGGRSDKQGNVYENRCLARTLIRLVTEEIRSVVVEPVGENTDICEFYTIGKDGGKTFFQCKGSNEMKDHWTPSDLQKHNLFSRIQKLLRSDPACSFHFISPLYYNGLDDLCSRAKTYPSAEDYLEYALSNQKLRATFKACEKYFNLDHSNTDQLNELVSLLSRCEFIVHPNNSETIQHLEQLISVYFWGVAGKIRVLLENYVNDTSSYGKELTVLDVLNYLVEKDIQPRTHLSETRISPAISRLNKNYYESYNAIRDTIFHRESTDLLIQEIEAGKSIVIHGKAGTGKSGCIRELINHLERNHIDYLAIQLDKHIPSDYADKYGESLGLPGSPVNCLSLLSGSKPCVLILDQLDALRWTALHSSTALDVCKEMIAQARGINKYTGGRVSIVFSVRTFDYENDTGIQSLFRDETQEESQWSVINVKSLTDNEVIQIVGEEYKQLPGRVKELIHTPSSLYVWLKLAPGKRMNQIESSQDMVLSWWRQIQDNYATIGHSQAALSECVGEIVTTISNSSSFALPRSMFLDDVSFSAHILDTVIKRDPMALCARYSFWLMRKDLQVLEEYYYPFLKNACYSPNPKLVTHVAQLVCAIAILTSKENVLSFLYSHPWTEETLDKICLEATYGFENEEYRTISQTILEHFLAVDGGSLHSIDRLFHEQRLDLQRDDRFIKTILQKRSSIDTIDAFIDFIKTQDVTISGFVEIIKSAVESIDENIHAWQKHRIEDGLVHAVIRLIDNARDDNELMECCLDILDKIFQKRILTNTAIYELLDGTG